MDSLPRQTSQPKPEVVVRAEEEIDGGWRYEIAITRGGETSEHEVTLGWRDHDYWCSGTVAPSRVLTALIEYVLAYGAVELPASFDAARARRWRPEVDLELRGVL